MLESIKNWDLITLIGIQDKLDADWLTPVMKGITFLGEAGWFWILICLGLLLCKKTRRLGILCALSLLLAFLCCNGILKPAVNRQRPWVVSSMVHALLPPPGDASFPSGHANASMAVAWAMWINTLPAKVSSEIKAHKVSEERLVPSLALQGEGADRRRMHVVAAWMIVLALLIGFSRLYLGLHFPTDVIGGLLTGMLSATAVYCTDCGIRKRKRV